MKEKHNIPLRLLSYIVIAYMLLAFLWWSVLLFKKNRDTFHAKTEVLKIGMIAEGIITSPQEFVAHHRYQELKDNYQKQEWMIMGEGLFFIITLIIGFFLINKGYNDAVNAARERRNFLLSITHELKSPLASIRLVLETFQKRQLTPELSQKLTNNALKETERLHGLVNDLLLSAKLDTGYQPHFEMLLLDDIVENIMERMEAKHSTAQFTFDVKDEIPAINADRMGITSVVVNLLENAVKYSPKEKVIKVHLSHSEGIIQLKIADNGIGISDKEKKRVFNKFYRVGNEDTRTTKGTGLGLYIVQQIVKAHGGTIQVVDNKPHGTVFIINLPIKN